MTLRECYEAMGGNYDEVMGRLRTEERVKKFALKFLADTSFDTLKTALAAGNGEEAFRAAHTMKGVTQDLSFDRLYRSSHEITEALRGGISQEAETMLPQVEADYMATRDAIEALQAGE